MKAIGVVFPKKWRVKVNISGIVVIFTEQDILSIVDGHIAISEIGPHEYLIKGEEGWLKKIFTNSFIKRLRSTGITIKIKN